MIIDELKESNALLNGHFLLSSGKHSGQYIQCAKLLMHPDLAEKAVAKIIDKIDKASIDLVVGPAMGGVLVSYEVGRQLGKPNIFVERENGEFALRRGFEIKKGQRVLVTEDVITTGKSIKEAIDLVEEHGGEVVALFTLVDRKEHDLDYKIYSGTEIEFETYNPENCPLCKEGSQAIKPGSRNLK